MFHTLSFLVADATPLSLQMRLPLSVMQFLEFAIWGAWFVVLGQYLNGLNFSGKQIGSVYATMSLASIVSPIFVGAFADRYFNTEWLMGVLHLAGAVLLFWMACIRRPMLFYWVTLVYALMYAPTIALSSSIIFANVPDGQRDFPTIRVLGTIGWIAANLSLKLLLKPGEPVNNRPLLLASGLSVALGVFSFFLPATPPQGKPIPFTLENIPVLLREAWQPFQQALGLLHERSFAVFFGISLLITLALAFYYSFTSLFLEQRVRVRPGNVGPLMTIGQWAEIFFLAGIPWITFKSASDWSITFEYGLSWFLSFFGMKYVLLMGMAAWGLRYAIFTLGRPFPLILLGLALHGICFDFFFAAGFIYVDQTAPPAIRASGQALFAALTYGVGMFLGTEASGWINQACTKETVDPQTGQKIKVTNWSLFWFIPCVGVVVSLALFYFLFK